MTTKAATTSIVHATCVAFASSAILLTGRSGCGKSDLALRLIHLGAKLVSDDQVVLNRTASGQLVASAPPNLKGLLEVRGVGLRPVEHVDEADLVAIIRLDDDTPVERLPDLEQVKQQILGVSIVELCLRPFEASAPNKVLEIVKHVREPGQFT